jgi:hypothetical protein
MKMRDGFRFKTIMRDDAHYWLLDPELLNERVVCRFVLLL